MVDFQENMEAVVNLRFLRGLHTPPALLSRLTQSCKLGHVCVVQTSMRRTIGYFAWIRVCRESYRQIQATGNLPTLYFENNEGYIRVVYDMVFQRGMDLYCKEELRRFIRRSHLVGRHRGKRLKTLSIGKST